MATGSVEISLNIKIKNETYPISGGNVKSCQLELLSYGFSGMLVFWLSDEKVTDKLITAFGNAEMIQFDLSIKNYTYDKKQESEAITLKGIITRRSVYEAQYIELKQSKILFRQYQCYFCDSARALWQQHFPTDLYIDRSLKEVISAQVSLPIKLECNWLVLDDKWPMICLGMGAGQLSFYDFLLDYLSNNAAFLNYDYSDNSYKITDQKDYVETELSFLPNQIHDLHITFAETNLQNVNLLNGQAEQAKVTVIKKSTVSQDIKNDLLMNTPFAKTLSAQKSVEIKLNKQPLPELNMQFSIYPQQAVLPGLSLCLANELWSKELLFYQQKYRIVTTKIKLEALDQQAQNDLDSPFGQYQFSYQVCCEEKNNVNFLKPRHAIKSFFVEGFLVCDVGDKQDKTYQYSENETSKQLEYRIQIPLWKKEIKVLFKPDFINPHFYFPLYKGTHVLLEMDLFEARIVRVLDWGKSVVLAQDLQGNQVLFGKNDKDQTSLQHIYQNNKSVFSIKRTKDKDTEVVRMEQGKIILEAKEDDQ